MVSHWKQLNEDTEMQQTPSSDSMEEEDVQLNCSGDISIELEPGETWIEYIKRVTAIADDALIKTRCRDWVCEQRRRKRSWAGHVARMVKWAPSRWILKLLRWDPQRARCVGRPKRRCQDLISETIVQYCEGEADSWILYAQDRKTWESLKPSAVDEKWR